MMEKNPLQAIKTNAIGTKIVSEAALRSNCERFILISTDKAVNPTNVMGRSKRVAEQICSKMNEKSHSTQFP